MCALFNVIYLGGSCRNKRIIWFSLSGWLKDFERFNQDGACAVRTNLMNIYYDYVNTIL